MAYILYGVITGESIAQLFMAGIGPGALLFGLYIVYVIVRGAVNKRSLFEKGVVPSQAALQKAKSPEARCRTMSANGRSCIPFIQKCYLQCKQRQEEEGSNGVVE